MSQHPRTLSGIGSSNQKGIVGKIIGALFVEKAKMKNIEESLQKLREVVEQVGA